MAVKPNVVVGVVGAVVFLLTGSVIVTGWRGLTDMHGYDATVQTFRDVPIGQRVADVGTGQSKAEAYAVPYANVTRITARLTWDESNLAQHEVTLSIRDAKGGLLAEEKVRGGGKAGLTIERTTGEAPRGGGFDTTAGNAEAEFEERYPSHDETRGTWTFTVSAAGVTGAGATGITYRLSFDVDYYKVTLAQREDTELVK